LSPHAFALNVVFGPDIGIHGMKVGASFIQGVTMSPMVKGMDMDADIHLETDVHALPGNPQGFPATAWIPGLKIHYLVTKQGTGWHKQGYYLPMVAQGGPHYGVNLKLDGPGHYLVTNDYQPATANGYFTPEQAGPGVYPWWQPFTRHYSFDFFGAGKHGGY
jgi:uncharacterized protein involved in high-affinity Fe2+ transport